MHAVEVEAISKLSKKLKPQTFTENQSLIERIKGAGQSIDELVDLATGKKAASDRFNDAAKAVAERCALDPAVLKAYVTAIATDTLEKKQMQAEQLALFLDERPEHLYEAF